VPERDSAGRPPLLPLRPAGGVGRLNFPEDVHSLW
jgi:hypothetical protein